MTLIENDSPKVQYTGPFIKGQLLPLTFPYIATEDVKMIIDDKPAIFNVDYEIITEPNDEHPVAYPNSAYIKSDLPNAKQITLYRVTPLDQQSPFPQQSKFRSERVEKALDKLTMHQQEQEEQLSRCIIAPITLETFNGQLPAPAADQALKWNTEGTELENYDIIGAQEAFEQQIKDDFALFEDEIDNKFVDYKNTVDSSIQGFKNDVNQTIDENQAELLEIANSSASIASQAMSVAQSTIDTANTARQIAEAAEAKSDSAVTVAGSANKNATNAVSTAEGAVTIATNASAKSDSAVATANTAQKQAQQAVTTANTAVETANNTQHRVDVFEEDINTVLDAADKILELDESVQTAVNAAELANQAAESATKAAEEAVNSLESKADLEDIKNGTLTIQNNGTTIATFSANQDSNVTANLLIPDTAAWGKITGTLSNQTDLQNALNTKANTSNVIPKTIGTQGIPATSTAPTALNLVGRQACGNGDIAGGNLIALHKNTLFRCYERGSTITCNYDDKVTNLGKTMCDGSFNGHYTQINPSTSFTSKPFVWEVTSPTQYEVSDVCRLHIYSHRLSDALNVTAFKIEAYIHDTLTNSKKWITAYEYSGASKNIAQTGFGLYKTGYSTNPYYAIFGIRLTISGSPDTIFRMSQVQIVASRGTETLADSLQCVSNAGGKIWGNLEVTGNLKASNSYTKTEVDNITDTKVDLDDMVELDMVEVNLGNRFEMFDTKLADHVLTYEESKGWALQGTYAYKNPVAGSRYGYPDFYAKCLEEYQNATIEKFDKYLSSNISLVGSLTDKQGVLSGFSTSNYATLPKVFPSMANWECCSRVKFSAVNATQYFFNTGASAFYGFLLGLNSNGVFSIHNSSNGSSWNIGADIKGTLVARADTYYYIKFGFNGSEYYFEYSLTGEKDSFIRDITITSTVLTKQPTTVANIGNSWNSNTASNMTLDLNNTYININGERWWSGTQRLEFDYLKNANGHSFYDITNKDSIDEHFNRYGTAWLYGVDTANERIFLPRNSFFDQATGDISEVGQSGMEGRGTGTASDSSQTGFTFDASRSNPIYGNSDTVQPNAVKKLLYICVGNTELQSSIIDVADITTTENDTTPLFTGMYFDFTPNNASWLKAGQQSNSGGIYKTCYNELVNVLKGETKYGSLKVVDESKMVSGTDYSLYWKVNQTNQTFTPPTAYGLVADLQGNKRVLVDRRIPTDEDPTWYNLYSDGWLEQGGKVPNSSTGSTITLLKPFTNANYSISGALLEGSYSNTYEHFNISSITNTSFFFRAFDNYGLLWQASGYAEIPSVDDYTENVNLYFKVANAVQNLELLDVGEVMEAVGNISDTVTTTLSQFESSITSLVLPDYTAGISVTWTDLNNYIAPADGVIMFEMYPQSNRSALLIAVNGVQLPVNINGPSNDADTNCALFFVGKGDVVTKGNTGTPRAFTGAFYPLKGAK